MRPQTHCVGSWSERASRWGNWGWFVSLLLIGSACGKPSKPAEPPPSPTPAENAEPPAVLLNAPAPPVLIRDVGFASPESALYDPVADLYLISNVNGGLMDADGNGFISRLAPDGTVMDLKWIAGGTSNVTLDAPKGMALVGDTLFVADVNVVRSFDRKSGQPLGKVAIVSASFLNDVAAAPDNTLYVSDSGFANVKGLSVPQKNGADTIYTLDARGVVGVLVKGAELGQPNGLLADAEGVWVANLAGQILRVSKQGQQKVVATLPPGLDGLALTEAGKLIVSSWQTSTVYAGSPPGFAAPGGVSAPGGDAASPGAFEPAIADLESPGDLTYDPKRHQLVVPLFKQNAVYIQQIMP